MQEEGLYHFRLATSTNTLAVSLKMASEAASGLGGHLRPQFKTLWPQSPMFQCFSGLYIAVFNKYSQEEEEKEEDKVDL